jgi:hypothetical protein
VKGTQGDSSRQGHQLHSVLKQMSVLTLPVWNMKKNVKNHVAKNSRSKITEPGGSVAHTCNPTWEAEIRKMAV